MKDKAILIQNVRVTRHVERRPGRTDEVIYFSLGWGPKGQYQGDEMNREELTAMYNAIGRALAYDSRNRK